nr:hypothetical protein [Tanacetum cinerariifolium]
CGCILSFREGTRHLIYTGAEAGSVQDPVRYKMLVFQTAFG